MIHVEDSRDCITEYDNANKYVCRDTHQSWLTAYDPPANTFGLTNVPYVLSRIAYRWAEVTFLSPKAIE